MLVAFGVAVASCADVLDVRTTRYLASTDSRCVGTLRVRLLVDLTGPTRDVAESTGKGFTDHLHAIDAEGGIRGCRIDLVEADSKYDVETALSEYRDWASRPEWDEVSTIFGPDTRVTKALAPLTAADGKVFLTSALNGALAAPTAVEQQIDVPTLSGNFIEATVPVRKSGPGYPSVFFHGTDYTTQARIAMSFAWKNGAKRVGFFACTTSDFCTDPVDGAKTFLPELGGTKVGRDLAIELEDDEAAVEAKIDAYAREELAHAADDSTYEPVDWIWFGNTRSTLAYVGKALAVVKDSLGYAPRVITNNWGIDEQLYEECGDDCAGMYGLHPYPMFDDPSVPGMDRLVEVHHAARKAEGESVTAHATVHYVGGYLAVATWRAAVEATLDEGLAPNGPNLKAALERFSQRSIETMTLSFSPEDHRPQSSARLYTLDVGGRISPVGRDLSIALQPEWLGW